MTITKKTTSRLLGLAAIALLAIAGTSVAQVTKGKTRPLQTKQLMGAVVKPHCTALNDGLKTPPATDKAWEELAAHAAVLNEVSYVLMDDGRCPDAVWADAATKALRTGSDDVLKALAAKDAAAAKTATAAMMKACGGCHEKHKKKAK